VSCGVLNTVVGILRANVRAELLSMDLYFCNRTLIYRRPLSHASAVQLLLLGP
jgi:hypothetical protein